MITRIAPSYQSTAVAAGRADDRRPVSRRRSATFLPALLVAGLAIGVSPGALAQAVPDHVFDGCVLNSNSGEGEIDTIAGLEADLEVGSGIGDAQVDFVLVYSLANDNDGQDLGEAGFTGPILCTRPAVVGVAGVNSTATDENTPIGTEADPVDITALEQALILQYDKDGTREKRICHTVAGNTDCFLITTAPPLPGGE